MDIIKYFERNYRSLLLCAVMMMRDADKAQDILHNVAVTLCLHQKDLADVQYPRAYVSQCIYRATLNYLRKESRSLAYEPDVLANIVRCQQSDVAYDYAEWAVSIKACLRNFDSNNSNMFIEHYLDGVPINEIAQREGMTVNAVTLRLNRMRKELNKNAPDMFRHIHILSLL